MIVQNSSVGQAQTHEEPSRDQSTDESQQATHLVGINGTWPSRTSSRSIRDLRWNFLSESETGTNTDSLEQTREAIVRAADGRNYSDVWWETRSAAGNRGKENNLSGKRKWWKKLKLPRCKRQEDLALLAPDAQQSNCPINKYMPCKHGLGFAIHSHKPRNSKDEQVEVERELQEVLEDWLLYDRVLVEPYQRTEGIHDQ